MNKFLEQLDSKTITSAGGIILAIMLSFFLYSLSGAKIDSVTNALASFQASDQSSKDKLANALLENAKVIEGNTRVMQQVLNQK